MQKYQVSPIGKVKIREEEMYIEVDPVYIPALQGLDGFRHLNIVWWFSDHDQQELRSLLQVPKPYKNAPEVMGIFATRSPFRPNPIALTTAEVIRLDQEAGLIQIAYIDAYNNTPVLDLKPYTPSLDRVEHPGVPEWCGHWPNSIEQSGIFAWENEFNF